MPSTSPSNVPAATESSNTTDPPTAAAYPAVRPDRRPRRPIIPVSNNAPAPVPMMAAVFGSAPQPGPIQSPAAIVATGLAAAIAVFVAAAPTNRDGRALVRVGRAGRLVMRKR